MRAKNLMPGRLLSGGLVVVLSSLMLTACGGHSSAAGKPEHYINRESGDDELDAILKFDSRVDSFEKDGAKLIVQVNESWAASPPGMQQFSLGQWFEKWASNSGKEVVVQYRSEELAKASGEHGIEFPEKVKEDSDEGEAS